MGGYYLLSKTRAYSRDRDAIHETVWNGRPYAGFNLNLYSLSPTQTEIFKEEVSELYKSGAYKDIPLVGVATGGGGRIYLMEALSNSLGSNSITAENFDFFLSLGEYDKENKDLYVKSAFSYLLRGTLNCALGFSPVPDFVVNFIKSRCSKKRGAERVENVRKELLLRSYTDAIEETLLGLLTDPGDPDSFGQLAKFHVSQGNTYNKKKEVLIVDTFENNIHTYTVTVDIPIPCQSLEIDDYFVGGHSEEVSSPNDVEIWLGITPFDPPESCFGTITPTDITVTIPASEDAQIKLLVLNGWETPFTVVTQK